MSIRNSLNVIGSGSQQIFIVYLIYNREFMKYWKLKIYIKYKCIIKYKFNVYNRTYVYMYIFICLPMHIWRRQWHPTPVLLPRKSHGWRSLVGCSPWGRQELDTTERLHFHFSLSCVGEGNGNPVQCSCLENPRDGEAWWAAVYGVAQSRTRLKRLSSSSSSICT